MERGDIKVKEEGKRNTGRKKYHTERNQRDNNNRRTGKEKMKGNRSRWKKSANEGMTDVENKKKRERDKEDRREEEYKVEQDETERRRKRRKRRRRRRKREGDTDIQRIMHPIPAGAESALREGRTHTRHAHTHI